MKPVADSLAIAPSIPASITDGPDTSRVEGPRTTEVARNDIFRDMEKKRPTLTRRDEAGHRDPSGGPTLTWSSPGSTSPTQP
jgi:hypothetical protein